MSRKSLGKQVNLSQPPGLIIYMPYADPSNVRPILVPQKKKDVTVENVYANIELGA